MPELCHYKNERTKNTRHKLMPLGLLFLRFSEQPEIAGEFGGARREEQSQKIRSQNGHLTKVGNC